MTMTMIVLTVLLTLILTVVLTGLWQCRRKHREIRCRTCGRTVLRPNFYLREGRGPEFLRTYCSHYCIRESKPGPDDRFTYQGYRRQ